MRSMVAGRERGPPPVGFAATSPCRRGRMRFRYPQPSFGAGPRVVSSPATSGSFTGLPPSAAS